jgi:4'-phosphopantetheinyl transferase
MTGNLSHQQDSHNNKPGANDLYIWDICTTQKMLPGDLSPLEACLSPQEQDRYYRLQRPEVRQNFLLSRGCLRYVLSFYLNCPPGAPEFTQGLQGKPELKPGGLHSLVQFNLSHTQEKIAIALHRDTPVGIDIEQLKPITRLEKLCQRCLTPQEAETVLRLDMPPATHRFLRYWTAKEAILKAMGLGLTYPMKHLEVFLESGDLASQPSAEPIPIALHGEPSPDLNQYWLYQWQSDTKWVAAVALQAVAVVPPVIHLQTATVQALIDRLD